MPSQNGNSGGSGSRAIGHKLSSKFEDWEQRWKVRFKHLIPSGQHALFLFAVGALALLGAWTAYYAVPSDSVAVVQRFGKYLKVVPAGLHFKLPLGIDLAQTVPVKRQLKRKRSAGDVDWGLGRPRGANASLVARAGWSRRR